MLPTDALARRAAIGQQLNSTATTGASNCNRQYNSQRKTNGTSAARATDCSVYPCAKGATKYSQTIEEQQQQQKDTCTPK
jgi:hypothetical protein